MSTTKKQHQIDPADRLNPEVTIWQVFQVQSMMREGISDLGIPPLEGDPSEAGDIAKHLTALNADGTVTEVTAEEVAEVTRQARDYVFTYHVGRRR